MSQLSLFPFAVKEKRMRKAYLEVGKIVTTHGIQGEVRVYPWCDTPEFLAGFRTLYLQNGKKPLSIERARVHKNV